MASNESRRASRVLVVHDDPGARQWCAGLLRLHGFEPVTVETGADGIARGGSEPFDLILVDLKLPDRPGTEVVKELNTRGVSAPKVILTAFPDPDFDIDLNDIGAVGYIDRPLFGEDFLDVVMQALAGRFPVRGPADRAGDPSMVAGEARSTRPMAEDPIVLKAVQLIDSHLDEHRTISALAVRFGLSESRLRHRFAARMGLSISEFRKEQRLRQMAHLLATTADAFKRIAEKVGLAYDLREARAAFHGRFGLTPKKYRGLYRRPPDRN